MAPPEDALAMAERQVLEGEKYVARQVVIFDELVRDGHEHAAAVAKMVLETLQTRLDLAREHLHLEHTRRGGAVIIGSRANRGRRALIGTGLILLAIV